MDILQNFISFILHLDKHLVFIVQNYGILTYLLLFTIIFLETGFVVTPFLPGDSLLFAAGTLSATHALNIYFLFFLLSAAAILGDTANYWIGYFFGGKAFKNKNSRFFKKEYLEKTAEFYQKHGGKTIILARFIPIIRTFAPFVAGVGRMYYPRFLFYNFSGGITWVFLFTFGGYWFGNLPIIKKNFHLAIILIILLSILPAIFEYLKHKKNKRLQKSQEINLQTLQTTLKKEGMFD